MVILSPHRAGYTRSREKRDANRHVDPTSDPSVLASGAARRVGGERTAAALGLCQAVEGGMNTLRKRLREAYNFQSKWPRKAPSARPAA